MWLFQCKYEVIKTEQKMQLLSHMTQVLSSHVWLMAAILDSTDNISIILESSLGPRCCRIFEDRVMSYPCGTCPELGLKGQPADNLIPISLSGTTILTPVNLDHSCNFTVHPINAQVLSISAPYFSGMSSRFSPFQLQSLCHQLTWLWPTPCHCPPYPQDDF